MPNYKFGDMKYYYQIHCARQKMLGNKPVCYERFVRRLKKMNLHDAIYTPRAEGKARDMKAKLEPTYEDQYRRRQTLNNENVQYLDFKNLEMVEKKAKKKGKIQMPKPKKKWYEKIIDLFKKE